MKFETLFVLGGVVFISGLLATIYFYISLRRRAEAAPVPSLARYFIVAAIVALVAYLVGSAVGIYGGCASPSAGNLCGIWGALGVGPLLSGIALWTHGILWRSRVLR